MDDRPFMEDGSYSWNKTNCSGNMEKYDVVSE